MTDFNLIPKDYLIIRRRKNLVQIYTGVLAAVLVCSTVLFGYFSISGKKLNQEVERLQVAQAATAQQRDALMALDQRRRQYENELRLLTGLRSGGAAKTMFTTIDRALPGKDVWFLDWQFRRAGVVVTTDQETVNTGYFIVVPDRQHSEGAKPWQVQTHMTIKGQARDHVALSTFVKNLFSQPEIEDVRVQRTTMRGNQRQENVEFDLAIVLNTEIEAS